MTLVRVEHQDGTAVLGGETFSPATGVASRVLDELAAPDMLIARAVELDRARAASPAPPHSTRSR
jgi:hypothetical protein